jgi:hypothetical protein
VPKAKRDIETGLSNKGFKRRENDHSYFVYYAMDGKKSLAATKTSHGRGFDIDDSLLSQMARQCGVTKQQFLRLVECPLQRDEYETILRSSSKL